MSAKTKIVVLHMKELIYTGIFVLLGILFLVLLFRTIGKDGTPRDESAETTAPIELQPQFIPGIYTTELLLGNKSVEVQVIVDNCSITSIDMVNVDESVTTMYPLLEPTLDTIRLQLYQTQSLEDITYAPEAKYTTLVLTEAIRNSLDKARLPEEKTTSG